MATAYTPPEASDFTDLMQVPALQEPTQQPVLRAYAAGEIGIETMVYQLLEEVRQRHPSLQAQLDEEAEARAALAREEAEMAANENIDEPTIVEYTKDGRRVSDVEKEKATTSSQAEPEETGSAIATDEPTPISLISETPATTSGHDSDSDAEDDSDWGGDADQHEID